MTETDKNKFAQKPLCKFKPTERIGLYLMVIIILIHSCSIHDHIHDMEAKIDKLLPPQQTQPTEWPDIDIFKDIFRRR